MTKCSREGSRKSSVYNQNGENYFEQVSAYNSMCTHLRRLLLAKNVVDTKNKSFTGKKTRQTPKTGDYKPKLIRGELSDSTIDKLALGVYQYPTNYESNLKAAAPFATRLGSERDEKEKYAKFVYDITRDIMESGRFSDADLHQVFKRHIQQNKGRLNMCKMLSEVYQLKVSLNMIDAAELDQDLEDFAQNELTNTPAIASPTSRRVTNDNKASEKLSYRASPGEQSKSSSGKPTVPPKSTSELLVSERDVLLSLMEAGIEPKMAQQICKSLHCKSRSPSQADSGQLDVAHAAVEAEEEQSYNSHCSSEGSTPREFDGTREPTPKENKNTQINWLTSD